MPGSSCSPRARGRPTTSFPGRSEPRGESRHRAAPANNTALIDLLDRVLQGGIVIQGDVVLIRG